MDSNEQNLLDLDALAPQSREIKLPGGKMVKLQPPSMKSLIRLEFLGERLRKAEGLSIEEIKNLVDELDGEIEEIVPEIKGVRLTPDQTLGLVRFITQAGASSTSKILEKNEVEVAKEDNSPKAEA